LQKFVLSFLLELPNKDKPYYLIKKAVSPVEYMSRCLLLLVAMRGNAAVSNIGNII
jgi:hypothetical protein